MATAKQTIRLQWKDPKTGAPQDRQVALPIKIGRESDNTIVLEPDKRASRHHALLDEHHGKVLLMDVGSANGTLVAGRKIDRFALKNKDQFQIGDTVFTIIMNTHQVICHHCDHKVDIRHYDCPYCGFSLVGAQKA